MSPEKEKILKDIESGKKGVLILMYGFLGITLLRLWIDFSAHRGSPDTTASTFLLLFIGMMHNVLNKIVDFLRIESK